MITQKETLNTIATMLYEGCSYGYIAGVLKITVADLKAAIAAWKL